jgi:hypothetical protein
MFSKLNKDFAKHAKGFQVILFVIIVIPFVFFMPGVDIFGVDGNKNPAVVGTVQGEDVDWDTYEQEARKYIATLALSEDVFPGIFNAVRDPNGTIRNPSLYSSVLGFIRDQKVIAAEKDFKDVSVSTKEIKEYVKTKFLPAFAKAFKTGGLTFKDYLETVRLNLKLGGAGVDDVIRGLIIRNRFEAFIKSTKKPTEQEIVDSIKKEERTYKLRSVAIKAADFNDEPLKEFYEKNKDKYREDDAIKASLVSFQYDKYEEAFGKKDYSAELKKAIAEALTKVTATDVEAKANITKDATEKFKQSKLKELALAEAGIFKKAIERSLKGKTKAEEIVKAFGDVAKLTKYAVQESIYVTKKNLEPGKYFFDEALTKAILTVSVENALASAEGQKSAYVLVFADKGSFTPFEQVRSEILEEVYKEKLDNYYLTNKEQFKEFKRYDVGVASFFTHQYLAEANVTDEDAKKVFDGDQRYKQAQRKLIQFSLPVLKDAKAEEKAAVEDKIKAFVKTLDGKTPKEVEDVVLKKEDGIVKQSLAWKANDPFAGVDNEILTEAFKTETGKFTKTFVKKDLVAVIFVAADRKETPFEEAKGLIKSQLTSLKLTDIAEKKAEKFRTALSNLKKPTVENVNKAVAEFEKSTTFDKQVINEIPAIGDTPLQELSQLQFLMLRMSASKVFNNVDFAVKMAQMEEDKPYSIVVNVPPSNHKAVAYIAKVFPEGYQDKNSEQVKSRIFGSLNDTEAKGLASVKAAEVKKALEAEADAKKLQELLGANNFKTVEEIKFKTADTQIKAALKDAPKAGEIASNFENTTNTIIYIESIKEITEEEITKLKSEYGKKLTETMQNDALKLFWEKAQKEFEVKVIQAKESKPAES